MIPRHLLQKEICKHGAVSSANQLRNFFTLGIVRNKKVLKLRSPEIRSKYAFHKNSVSMILLYSYSRHRPWC